MEIWFCSKLLVSFLHQLQQMYSLLLQMVNAQIWSNIDQLADVDVNLVFFFYLSDNLLTLTIDGHTLFTYQETEPFQINYFGFAGDATTMSNTQFYYNCTSSLDYDSEESVESQTNIHHANGSDHLLCASVATFAMIAVHLGIAAHHGSTWMWISTSICLSDGCSYNKQAYHAKLSIQ